MSLSDTSNRTLFKDSGILYYGHKKNIQRTRAIGGAVSAKGCSRDRSRFVSDALAARLKERDDALIRACEMANENLEVAENEKEFDGLADGRRP